MKHFSLFGNYEYELRVAVKPSGYELSFWNPTTGIQVLALLWQLRQVTKSLQASRLLSVLNMSIFLNTKNIDWHIISTIICLWNNKSFFQGKIQLITRMLTVRQKACFSFFWHVFHMGFTTVGHMTLGNSLNTWPLVSLSMNSLQNSWVSLLRWYLWKHFWKS